MFAEQMRIIPRIWLFSQTLLTQEANIFQVNILKNIYCSLDIKK